MALGPGKYDELCTLVREETRAEAALVIIINGKKGSGFSCQSEHFDALLKLPELLEDIAKQIRESGL